MRDYAHSNRTEITAICDLDPKKLEDVSKELGLKDNRCFTDYDEFLNSDIDAVTIVTPFLCMRSRLSRHCMPARMFSAK